MDEGQVRVELGPYWLTVPISADVSAQVSRPSPSPGSYKIALTHWTIQLGRYQFLVHLSTKELGELKSFIDYTTKSDAITRSINVNGVQGVTHGEYGPSRTWIDWWFKKGDVALCLCLQSKALPVTSPTEAEIAEHKAMIASIKYSKDFPRELPPDR
jgi:hypothetical protein